MGKYVHNCIPACMNGNLQITKILNVQLQKWNKRNCICNY